MTSPLTAAFTHSARSFFSIEIPRYSTYEMMRDRLRYAFQHCQAIDTDGGPGEVWSDDEGDE